MLSPLFCTPAQYGIILGKFYIRTKVRYTMPLYTPNIRFSDCWGSMGNITFFHREGKCYWKTKPTTIFRNTLAQSYNSGLHRRALDAWRGLDHDEQLEWNAIAKGVPSRRPPHNPKAYISGYNLFVSAYHGFAQLGDEHTPEPTPFTSFPQFSITFDSAIVIEDKDLLLTFNTTTDHRFRIAAKVQLTFPGGGIRPGLMRSFLSVPIQDNQELVAFLIPNYKETWHLDLTEYQAHIRYFLIDSQTGYRSREQQISVRFEI